MRFTTLATSPLLFGSASLVAAVSPPLPQDAYTPRGVSNIIPQGTKVHQEHEDRTCFILGTFDPDFDEFSVSLVDGIVNGHLTDGFCHNHATGVVKDSKGNNCVFDDRLSGLRCSAESPTTSFNLTIRQPPAVNYPKASAVQAIQNALEHVCTRYPPTCALIPSVMEVVLSSMEVIADVARLYKAILTGQGLEDFNRPALPELSETSHGTSARAGHSNDQGSFAVIDNVLHSAILEFICEELCSPICDHIPSIMRIVDSILKGNADLQELTNAFQYYLARITPADVQTITEGAEDIYDIFATTPSKIEDLVDAIKIDYRTLGLDGTWRLLRAGLSVYFRLSPSDEHKLFQTLGDIISRFDASGASN
ncbi:hypothetical protein BDP81DRAFT_396567 [Colletotrichum phormii]|uniref:Uncharacterized protein n=1 Tax=Colletotrichum phormii TaxID=359342 RepID=A0AAI9ZKT8_9PEZI|nr:uncharacterized protein BDP81DRAFT_396567 [Colletotrichum phormii]KAK1633823.1 hypothetical protein BDP81DRAFT_396567 [Colletotrichum phormii]